MKAEEKGEGEREEERKRKKREKKVREAGGGVQGGVGNDEGDKEVFSGEI